MKLPRPVKIIKFLGKDLKQTLAIGLFLLLPIVSTYLILRFVFNNVDDVLAPVVEQALGQSIPGSGILALLILVYITGILGRSVFGRRIVPIAQNFFLKIPVVRAIYSPAKQLMESFFGAPKHTGFKRVVIIEYPRPGTWTIGFLTAVTTNEQSDQLGVVYIPTAPMPNSGWVVILKMSEVYDTDMTVSNAINMVLSGGIITPKFITTHKGK